MKRNIILIISAFVVCCMFSSCKEILCNCTHFEQGTVINTEDYPNDEEKNCSEYNQFDDITQTGVKCE